MLTTDENTMPQIQEQANHLRQELKEWEKSFAAANQGRKAERDDIKAHPTIAFKYKAYTKLRDLLSGHAPPTDHSSSPHPHPHSQPQQQYPHQPSRKRKHAVQPPADAPHPHITPRKLPRHSTTTTTPLKIQHPSQLDPYDSPSSIRKLTLTPRILRTSIGPTPQRDGRVLGLFDAFPDDFSPSKPRTTLGSIPGNAAAQNGNINGNVAFTTPRKKRATVVGARADGCVATPSTEPGRKQSRTPTSSGKRFLLDSYATPTARRTLLHPDPNTRNSNHNGSASSLRFATPAFLRRVGPADGDTVDEHGEARLGTGMNMRLPLDLRAPVRGGLSSLLAGLRRMEDERLDGEMEVLREMEEDENGNGNERKAYDYKKTGQLGTKDGVLVRDSQAGVVEQEREVEMPLGVDRGSSDSDSDSDSRADRKAKNTKPRAYKKKGQKRTTRRVVMKPQPLRAKGISFDPSSTTTTNNISAGGEGTTDGGGDGKGSGRETTQLTDDDHKGEKAGGSGGVAKKAARKISATAHANYRTLKLRGKGAKSNGKGNGRRFGGRR